MNFIVEKKLFKRILIGINVVLSIVYILIQWFRLNNISDSIFVGMLLSATIFLIINMDRIYKDFIRDGKSFYILLFEGESLEKVEDRYILDIKKLFNTKASCLFCVFFVIGFGVAINTIGSWANDSLVNSVFLAYIVVANIITGIAIYTIFNVLIKMYQWCNKISIDIWNKNNQAVKFLRKLRSKILITTSTYIAVSLSSILFSNIEIGPIFMLYTAFAIILIILVYSIPEVIFKNKRIESRDKLLDNLNMQISFEYNKAIYTAKDTGDEIQLDKLNALFAIKEKIVNDSSNKLDLSKIFSFIWLIFLTSLPIFLQLFLEKFFS